MNCELVGRNCYYLVFYCLIYKRGEKKTIEHSFISYRGSFRWVDDCDILDITWQIRKRIRSSQPGLNFQLVITEIERMITGSQ